MNPTANAPALPFAVATLGIATFAAMDAMMKGLAIEMGTYNAMLWRTLAALLIATVLAIWSRARWPSSSVIRLHVWRGVITAMMAFLFFWGLVYVPLAEAIGLSFIAPLIALYLAVLLLNEKMNNKTILASMLGLAGAGVIVSGKLGGNYSDEVGKGMAAILISAVLYAYNLILQRQQAMVAKPFEIAFFQNATMVFVYLLFAPFWAISPSSTLIPALVGAAFLGIISLLLISWAYARAEATHLITVEYTAFIWAALLGWLVFAETITTVTLSGTALIVIGCLIATKQQPQPLEP